MARLEVLSSRLDNGKDHETRNRIGGPEQWRVSRRTDSIRGWPAVKK